MDPLNKWTRQTCGGDIGKSVFKECIYVSKKNVKDFSTHYNPNWYHSSLFFLLKNNRIKGEIAHSKAHRSHKYVNNAWSESSNSPPTLLFIPFPVPPH
jgi:hypothetical protein